MITRIKTVLTTDVFDHWMGKLRDKVVQSRIRARISRMELGNLGDAKSVGDGVREMRIHTRPGYRIYFIEREIELIILLCGGDKSDQQHDIEKAKILAKNL